MSEPGLAADERRWRGVALIACLVTLAPFLKGILRGQTFYFRDLSLHFFPLRLFALEGLRHGEWRYWIPHLHEGIPAPFPPVSYPLDLLQLLHPTLVGLSLSLALHVPLAAVGFAYLARLMGVGRVAALGGAMAYAWGGFALSMLNLYVYIQALAWAPWLLYWCLRCARGEPRTLIPAALSTMMALSTAGIEVVAQTILLLLLLGLGYRGARRMLLALVLGAGLAAPTLCVMSRIVAGTERGAGFTTDVVFAQSIHPLTLIQILIADFYGDLGNIANHWWGSRFFPRGFPYVLSLYLGLPTLAVAIVGARSQHPWRRRFVGLAVIALLGSMGRWLHLEWVLVVLPFLRAFRFPTKLFFSVHLCVALLAALGLERLKEDTRAWRALMVLSLTVGAVFVTLRLLPSIAPNPYRWFVWGFLPPQYSWPQREQTFAVVLRDAQIGGLIACAIGALAWSVIAGRIRRGLGAAAVAATLAADLLRAGAGLNPMVRPSFYDLSDAVSQQIPFLRQSRVYTCEPSESRAFSYALTLRPGWHEPWTFGVFIESLTPNANLLVDIRTALSEDLTSLVPRFALAPSTASCRDLKILLPRLREAGVGRVLSLDPLANDALRFHARVTPPRIAPLVIYIYELTDARPLLAVADMSTRGAADRAPPAATVLTSQGGAGWLDVDVRAEREAALLVRENDAPGWVARVNGRPAPVRPVEDRYRAVAIPAGLSHVTMDYRPPGLREGVVIALASASALIWFAYRSTRAREHSS